MTVPTNHNRESAFLRIWQIVGNAKAKPPIPPLIPVGKSSWWQMVREGRAPAPIKLGKRTTAWRACDIDRFIQTFNATKTGGE